MSDTEPGDQLVVVCTYSYRHEAEVGRSMLAAHEVDAVIRADDFGGVQPMLGAINGVQLLVRRSDEHKARDIVARYVRGEPLADQKAIRSWRCPTCNELIEGQFQACWKCGRAKRDS